MNVPLRPTTWPATTTEPFLSTLPPAAPLAMPKQVLTAPRLRVTPGWAWVLRIWPGLRQAG